MSFRLPTGRDTTWNNITDGCRSKGDPSSPLDKVAKTLSMNMDFNAFDKDCINETETTSKKAMCPLLQHSLSLEHSTKVATGKSERSQGRRLSLRCNLMKNATTLRQMIYKAESYTGIGKPPKEIPNVNKHPSHIFASPQEMDEPLSHTTTVDSSANLENDLVASTLQTHKDPSLQSSTRKLTSLYDLPSLADAMPIIENMPLMSKATTPNLPGTPISRWRNILKSRSTELDPVLGMEIIVSHTQRIYI
jgi:hypothetical protein